MAGFHGPPDIFRNPSGLFRVLNPCEGDTSPFDLALNWTGSDFAVMNMHFKFGLHEHMASGAIHGLIELIKQDASNLLFEADPKNIEKIKITSYEPAVTILGDLAKRDPHTRQSADHSMVYIIASTLRKAFEKFEHLTV